MSASEHLSPQQFVQQHVGFDRWAKSEYQRNQEAHEVSPGHVRYPPEVGARQSRLADARTWLDDHYSQSAHAKFEGEIDRKQMLDEIAVPLHEALPVHHDLVDEYLNRGKA